MVTKPPDPDVDLVEGCQTASEPPPSVAQAILHSAVRHLDAHGVAGFRIERVLRDANASQGSLRYYFTNREGLIRAAEFERYLRLGMAERAELLELMDHVATNDEFCGFVAVQLTRIATDPAAIAMRRSRVSVYANALDRPELQAAINWLQDGYLALQTEFIERAQARGMINPDLNVYDYAAFFHGLALSRTFIEGTVDDPARWLAIAIPAATAPLRLP
ncbi:unannotated protein [freshwater metagenome]|uniref:Unannotated protein n=1 Tax=freshwater metagenome TaxID=449393 RepID=A0A6J7FMY0_9ZZZZ|nr:TetR family transcriptional regulator [Actinomycetota bacterium]